MTERRGGATKVHTIEIVAQEGVSQAEILSLVRERVVKDREEQGSYLGGITTVVAGPTRVESPWPKPWNITPEEFEDAAEEWHTSDSGMTFHDWLGWTWEEYAAYGNPKPTTLFNWQVAVNTEAKRRWGDVITLLNEVAALFEEGGEVARCIVKRGEGTRGTADEWSRELRVEIGQTMFVLLNVAALEGLDIEDCLKAAWIKFVSKPMKETMDGKAIPAYDDGNGALTFIKPPRPANQCGCDCHYVNTSTGYSVRPQDDPCGRCKDAESHA